jgi:hypothetical protein
MPDAYEPGGQGLHADCPPSNAKLPIGQGKQAVAPVPGPKLPGEQP